MSEHRRLKRDDDPPPFVRVTPIVKVGATDILTLTVIGETVQGYWSHWTGNDNLPHFEPAEDCPSCRKGYAPNKWSGFLHCFSRKKEEHCFLELTRMGRDDLYALRKKASLASTRGMICTFTRARKDKHAPLTITHVGLEPSHLLKSSTRDVYPTLERIWHLDLPRQTDGPSVE